MREMMNMKVFVDTDADTRLVRRSNFASCHCNFNTTVVRRDIAERGRDLDGVLAQYEKFVKPSFDEYASHHLNI